MRKPARLLALLTAVAVSLSIGPAVAVAAPTDVTVTFSGAADACSRTVDATLDAAAPAAHTVSVLADGVVVPRDAGPNPFTLAPGESAATVASINDVTSLTVLVDGDQVAAETPMRVGCSAPGPVTAFRAVAAHGQATLAWTPAAESAGTLVRMLPGPSAPSDQSEGTVV